MNHSQGNYFDRERGHSNLSNPGLRRAAGFAGVALAYFLALPVLGSLPESGQQSAARWQDTLSEADTALRNSDIYTARSLYSRTARIASWSDDWIGIVAAACGLKKLEKPRDDYYATRTMLVRAMIAAEKERSALGLNAVANAFTSIGEPNAAAMARGRIPVAAPESAAKNSAQPRYCG